MDPNAPLPTKYQKGEILLIDKPSEWTSFDVVNKLRGAIRRVYNIRKIKVGHAGTLDPLATGLLIICTGKSTKKINDLTGLTKEYTGRFVLGATTPSFDAEEEIDHTFETNHITDNQVREVAQSFLGEQDQVPPLFSAIHINGERAYKLAREGREAVLKSRKINIHEFEITHIDLPNVDFRLKVSKGTYIRSIARDFGLQLESGAYLKNLRRTKIGDFDIQEALTVEQAIAVIESSL